MKFVIYICLHVVDIIAGIIYNILLIYLYLSD